MISLFRRAPAPRAGRRGRVVLRLEGFEPRDTPSANPVTGPRPISATGGPTSTTGNSDGPGTTNNPPAIVDFAADGIGDGWYVISGRVVDEHPGGLTIRFGGDLATMDGQTTTTAADGTFSVLVCLKTNGTDRGWLSAVTQDDLGQSSNVADVYVNP